MAGTVNWISKQDARHRLVFSLIVAGAVFLGARGHVRLPTATILAWDAFSLCVLALAWLTILTTPPGNLRARAQEQDLSRTLIFIFIVVCACASLFAVGFLLHTNKGEQQGHLTVHLALTVLAVIMNWSLVHTVFGLRYAHTFYGNSDEGEGQKHAGGLDFPDEAEPGYLEFAYFSFVIGMTCQTSDVAITSREMRQLALLHGVLCFGFNTVILALTINTVSGFL